MRQNGTQILDFEVKDLSEDKFKELVAITLGLVKWTKIWKEQYGGRNKQRLIYWQEKMDNWHEENVKILKPNSEIVSNGKI